MNNYQQNNPYNANQGYSQQPSPEMRTPQYTSQYPNQAQQNTSAPDPYAYANPYAPSTPAPAPKKSKKGLIIGLIAGVVIIVGVVVALLLYFNSDSYKYGVAKGLMEEGKYDDAITAFTEIDDYKDSADLIDECNYKKAEGLFAEGKYDEARNMFAELGDYKDSAEKVNECDYQKACTFLSDEKYKEAAALFKKLDYKDSHDKFVECNRRILYNYLDKNSGSVSYYSGDYVYKLATSADKELDLMMQNSNSRFNLRFKINSDDATFVYVWDASGTDTIRGKCKISELTTDNDLEAEDYTGSDYMMDDLTNSSCNLACIYLPTLLDKTGLGLSPADIGFTSLD